MTEFTDAGNKSKTQFVFSLFDVAEKSLEDPQYFIGIGTDNIIQDRFVIFINQNNNIALECDIIDQIFKAIIELRAAQLQMI